MTYSKYFLRVPSAINRMPRSKASVVLLLLSAAFVSNGVNAIELISQRIDGTQGANGTSWDPGLSRDGNLVTFSSDASDLVADDTNGNTRDIFVYNRTSGEMRNLTNGANGTSDDPVISADGQWLAFRTEATNLPTATQDSNGAISDIVLANVSTGELTLVTAGGNGNSSAPSLSGDGRRLVYETLASNLASSSNHHPIGCDPASANEEERCVSSVVLYDRVTGFVLELTQGGTSRSRAPAISENGQHVVFESSAFFTARGRRSLIVMNLETGQRLAAGFVGQRLENTRPIISADGNYVAAMHIPISTRTALQPVLYVFDIWRDERALVGYLLSLPGAFSSDGQWLYYTEAAYLIAPTNYQPAVYRKNLADFQNLDTQVPERLTPVGLTANGRPTISGGPAISSDGKVLVWDSAAVNFADDNNGDLYDVFVLDTGAPSETNRPPIAEPQSLAVDAGASLSITLSGTDPDNDDLSFILDTEPGNGRLDGVPPELVYTPTAGYSGTDQFTFVVQDAEFTSDPAEIRINIAATNGTHTLTATQRPDSRVIDLEATWPSSAVWTQVREYDGPTGILWDGQATEWRGTYEPAAGTNEVTFNSRYWLAGITEAQDSIDVTVTLRTTPPEEPEGLGIDGFAWFDADGDARRDDEETPDIGRTVTLYRCAPPWGSVGTTRTAGTFGTFEFTGLLPGSYQLGTTVADAEFSPVGNDNAIAANGFSNCFNLIADSAQPQLGIGVLVADLDRATAQGFAWLDANNDGVRDATEFPDVGRLVTAYRCMAPWGVAGSAATDGSGNFTLTGLLPGMYQFGIDAAGITLSPRVNDNDMYPNGFSDCLDVTVQSRDVGIGISQDSGGG